jgi:hypothetical protein
MDTCSASSNMKMADLRFKCDDGCRTTVEYKIAAAVRIMVGAVTDDV